MTPPTPPRGPWLHRLGITTFTLIIGLLFYWLLGFVLGDIGSIAGPRWDEHERRQVGQAMLDIEKRLQEQITDVQRQIKDQTARQAVLRDSASNSEMTMNRLLEVQKLTLQKGADPSPEEQQALAESEQLFLNAQRQYQEVNDQVSSLTDTLRGLEAEQRQNNQSLETARAPARIKFQELLQKHQLKLGLGKMALLVPLLAAALYLYFRNRASLYQPLSQAAAVASSIKILVVMHDHFPRRFFKYILILSALAAAIFTLVYLLRMVRFPKKSWLLKQYREAYERFLCPICAYPIRRGPLRYAFWTRNTAKRLNRTHPTGADAEEPYVCPVCSTRLHEECPSCHQVRASLLPACCHCGTPTETAAKAGATA
ncbi:MAG: hypothetical protein RI897_2230 [Verrucomicrobiota bacterium]|jgi:hypothetical protein